MSEHNQEALLVRYADNQCNPAERKQAEALIKSDDAAAGVFAALEKTRPSLQQNFDSMLPQSDPALADLINNWQPQEAAQQKPAGKFKVGAGAIAATLVVGLLAGHLLTNLYTARSTSGAIYSNTDTDDAAGSSAAQTSTTPRWIRLVADYHRLYSRQTIENAPAQEITTVSATVSEWLDRDTNIPDLSDSDISFRRAQQLSVNDDTLVQLAYLPSQDKPVAICIRKTRGSDNTTVSINDYEGMQYAEWQDGHHAVVIVGHLPRAQLEIIAESVRGTLFGSA